MKPNKNQTNNDRSWNPVLIPQPFYFGDHRDWLPVPCRLPSASLTRLLIILAATSRLWMIALCSVSVRKGCNQRHLQVTSALTARRAVTALCSGAGGGVKGKKKKRKKKKHALVGAASVEIPKTSPTVMLVKWGAVMGETRSHAGSLLRLANTLLTPRPVRGFVTH